MNYAITRNPRKNRVIDGSFKLTMGLCLGLLFSIAPVDSAQAASRPDTRKPTVPSGLTAAAASSSQINLAWTASYDKTGVTGYKVYRNGAQIATAAGTSFSNTGLTAATTYSYTVSAYDAAGNTSAQSTSVSATTQAAADTTAPSVPGGLTATAVSSSQINLAWTAATDAVAITGYKVFRNGAEFSTVAGTSFSNTGLTASTAYSYTVSAYDAAGNTSAQSTSVSATTSASGTGTGGDTEGDAGVSGVPAGIYSIDKVVDKPFVDGVLIRMYWSQVEKTEGVYDFSRIATTIKQAQALGQGVTLATMALAAPDWLSAKSETFNNTQGISIVPWDPTMLTALEKLATALSNYQVDGIALRDHPTVRQINTPIGGIQGIRLTLMPAGYTVAKMEEGVFRSVRAFANAFPNKHLYTALFGVSDGASNPTTVEYLRDKLLAEFNGASAPRMNFFQELLSGEAPTMNSPLATIVADVKDATSIMYQACGEWSNQAAWSWCFWLDNDTPDAGFKHGFNDFNTTYYEIYEADLLNSAYADQFQQWHDALQAYIQ